MKKLVWLACLAFSVSALAETRSISIVNYETNGVKQWLPGTVVVKKGDDVELTLINKVPSGPHGFEIPDFKVRVVVKKDVNEVVKFKADKEGVFPINCHMHKPHVGGQLVVLP